MNDRARDPGLTAPSGLPTAPWLSALGTTRSAPKPTNAVVVPPLYEIHPRNRHRPKEPDMPPSTLFTSQWADLPFA
ncbi:hypothetical protein ARTHRO9AX_220331 [Arthrobacter sp. 9AX]|nr:hypothetical protein ARTHRO9AX_220331 [Arthrobacter sp. 9AX]